MSLHTFLLNLVLQEELSEATKQTLPLCLMWLLRVQYLAALRMTETTNIPFILGTILVLDRMQHMLRVNTLPVLLPVGPEPTLIQFMVLQQ
jgi:hypothetical protein